MKRWLFIALTSSLPGASLALEAEQQPAGSPLRWTILHATHDARDAEMVAFDEEMDRRLIQVLNTSAVFGGRLRASVAPIEDLLESHSAFASLHFDPAKPMKLDEDEAGTLAGFMQRGGFLLLVENNYAYPASIYRRPNAATGALFDFIAQELSRRDPKFRSEKLPLDHTIFEYPYEIEVPPAIVREMEEDPGYIGETVFFHDDRLVGYTYSLFGFDDGREFQPLERPFHVYSLMEAGYRVLVNIYTYASSH